MGLRLGWAVAYGAAIGLWALVRWPAYHAGPPPETGAPAGPLVEAAVLGLVMTGIAALAGGRWQALRAQAPARPAAPRGGPPPAGPEAGAAWASSGPAARPWGGVVLVGLAAAAGWLAPEAWTRAAWRPAPWEGAGEIAVTGRLLAPDVLAVDMVAGVAVATRLRLDWPAGGAGTGALPSPRPPADEGADGGSSAPGPGQRVAVWGTLRRLRPATNPGGYDARAAGLREGFAYELRVTRWSRLAPVQDALDTGPASGPRPDARPVGEGTGAGAPPGPRAVAGAPAGGSALATLRQALLDGLERALPPGPRGVAAALLLDERQGLSATAREALAATGLIHALAVSGQHVAMAAALAAWLAGRAGWLPGRRRLAVAAVVVLYAGLTGGPPSVLRATATFLLGEGARAVGRPVTPLEVLAWAAFVQAAFRPLVFLDPGFQLSFAATAGLILLAGPLQRAWRRRWQRWAAAAGTRARLPLHLAGWAGDALAVTLAAQVAVVPVQVALFGRLPLLALVANLVVVPLSGAGLAAAAAAAVVGAMAAVLPLPAAWEEPAAALTRAAGWPAAVCLTAMVRVAMVAGALPAASGGLAAAAAGWLAFAAGWVLWRLGDPRPAYARRLRPVRLAPGWVLAPAGVAVAAAVAVSALVQKPPPPGTWVAWFLDVGQGDAVLLRFPGGGAALVDTGGKALAVPAGAPDGSGPGTDRYWPGRPPAIPDAVGEGVTVPVVRRLLGRGPDLLVVTHADRDHAGGAGAVLERLGAGRVWLGGVPGASLDRALVELAARRRVPLQRPEAGWTWQPAPGCRLEVLHPARPSGPEVRPSGAAQGSRSASGGTEENNRSVVLRVGCGGPRLLQTGDLEQAGEAALLARGTDVAAEVLKVSHHGSRGATSAAFLAAVRPRLAIVSVGPNPYGLPHVETLARLRRAGIPVLRTDRSGAIRIQAEPSGRLIVQAMIPESLPPLGGEAAQPALGR